MAFVPLGKFSHVHLHQVNYEQLMMTPLTVQSYQGNNMRFSWFASLQRPSPKVNPCLLVNVPMVEISTDPTDSGIASQIAGSLALGSPHARMEDKSTRSTGKPLFVSWREEADSFDRPGWLTTATAVLWHGRLSCSASCYEGYAPVNSHSYWTLKWHNSLQYLPIRKGDLSWLC